MHNSVKLFYEYVINLSMPNLQWLCKNVSWSKVSITYQCGCQWFVAVMPLICQWFVAVMPLSWTRPKNVLSLSSDMWIVTSLLCISTVSSFSNFSNPDTAHVCIWLLLPLPWLTPLSHDKAFISFPLRFCIIMMDFSGSLPPIYAYKIKSTELRFF